MDSFSSDCKFSALQFLTPIEAATAARIGIGWNGVVETYHANNNAAALFRQCRKCLAVLNLVRFVDHASLAANRKFTAWTPRGEKFWWPLSWLDMHHASTDVAKTLRPLKDPRSSRAQPDRLSLKHHTATQIVAGFANTSAEKNPIMKYYWYILLLKRVELLILRTMIELGVSRDDYALRYSNLLQHLLCNSCWEEQTCLGAENTAEQAEWAGRSRSRRNPPPAEQQPSRLLPATGAAFSNRNFDPRCVKCFSLISFENARLDNYFGDRVWFSAPSQELTRRWRPTETRHGLPYYFH